MPTKDTQNIEASERGPRAGVSRSEPGGRAQRGAGAARAPEGPPLAELAPEVRDRLSDQVIDELLAGARTEEEIVGPGGLLADLTRPLVERAMSAELTEHLGYERHQEPPGGAGNTRNGWMPKTLATEHGPVPIKTPRDRKGTFEPQLVRKGQRRFEGFDEKILALYSRGLSTRDIEAHLEEIYGVKVGRDLISRVTDAVLEDVRAWQQRPLDDVYPVVFLDCLVIKVREAGSVQRRACYLALGVNMDGDRDVLGIWFQETEGAKFWLQVLNDLKQRGVEDPPIRKSFLLQATSQPDEQRSEAHALGVSSRTLAQRIGAAPDRSDICSERGIRCERAAASSSANDRRGTSAGRTCVQPPPRRPVARRQP